MILDKIKAIVGGISEIKEFIYHNNFGANVMLDNAELPCCVLLLLTDVNYNLTNGNLREVASVNIFFFDRAKLDFDGEENETIIERMNNIALKFIIGCRNSDTLKINESSVTLRRVYDEYDANLTGISVTCTIQELQGTCITEI